MPTSNTFSHSDRILYLILLVFLAVNFFFPAWATDYGLYYCSFILANAAAFLFIAAASFLRPTESVVSRPFICLTTLILLYSLVNLCFSIHHLGWYWDLVNKSISFLFFFTLIYKTNTDFIDRYSVIQTVILLGAVAALASVIFYFAGYDTIDLRDFVVTVWKQGEYPYYTDTRLTWVYTHKSTYSMVLLLLSALTIRYYKRFRYSFIPLLCLGLFTLTMILVNTMAATACLFLIYVGYFLHRILQKRSGTIKYVFLGVILCLGIVGGIFLYHWISGSRNLTTLGNRLPIWKAGLNMIRQNPWGIGTDFAKVNIWGDMNNCHSTFLNEILRFSIPVGGLYALIFIVMMLFTVWKDTFFSLSIWVAFFLSINMDYTLQAQSLSLVLLLLYFLFFYPGHSSVSSEPKR